MPASRGTQRVRVEWSAADGASSTATGELTLLSAATRAGRALGVMALAAGIAALLIPVPIVHLVGIPLVLVIGLGVALRQLRAVARLAPLRLACPRCNAANALGGGLGYRSATGPIQRPCESCRRMLEVRFVNEDGKG